MHLTLALLSRIVQILGYLGLLSLDLRTLTRVQSYSIDLSKLSS